MRNTLAENTWLSDDDIRFIEVLMLLRVSVALSLGVIVDAILPRHENGFSTFEQYFGFSMQT